VRICYAADMPVLEQAADRISAFLRRYSSRGTRF